MARKTTNIKTVQPVSKADAGVKKDEFKKPVMVEVEALITPVITDKAIVAKGGRVPMDQATAEMKAKLGEVVIVKVLG